MLATFVIGLREGLEASLIVGIIAAFLRQNGRSLRPLWIGVGLAVLLSAIVGGGLKLIEASLPQAEQEGMETVIGAVAVVFVTGMVLWMMTHARGLKKELESSAQEALGAGSSRALAVMAFLAVLKEGFETSVFLLATFQAAANPALAATGAVLGVAVAVVIGWGIYRGGVRLNLGRFFKITGAFLLLVAAGLVVSALRTGHEAGWINAGQQRVLDLHWLAPAGSVRGALFTGVLGIPVDPRLIEVLGWFAYLIPVALLVYWPVAHRPDARAAGRIRLVIATALAAAAVVLALAVRTPGIDTGEAAPLSGGTSATARLQGDRLVVRSRTESASFALGAVRAVEHRGVQATQHTTTLTGPDSARPTRLTSAQLLQLTGGRLPVGIDASRAPGPYAARWTRVGERDVWTTHGRLLDATQSSRLVLTLSGGGLTSTRTLSVTDATSTSSLGTGRWAVRPTYADGVARSAAALPRDRTEARFWGRTLPIVSIVAALLVLFTWWRRRPAAGPTTPVPGTTTARVIPEHRSTAHVR